MKFAEGWNSLCPVSCLRAGSALLAKLSDMRKVYRGALIGLESEYCLNSDPLHKLSQRFDRSAGITSGMPRNFRSRKQFWVLFGLLAVSFRILTGAPEAQVNFTSLFVDQNTQVISEQGVAKLLQITDAENSTDANSIPEKHHTYSTYKKYLTPDNHFINLVNEVQHSNLVASRILFAPWIAKETQKITPNSHSPPAVVSAHSLTYTTTTEYSVVMENNFEEFKVNHSSWEFRGFNV